MRAEPLQLRQVVGHQEHQAERGSAKDEHRHAGNAEVVVPEQAQVDERALAEQLGHHEHHQRNGGDHAHADDERRAEPVQPAAFFQHDLQAAQADHHGRDTQPITFA
ncbi:hypothetical protein D3C78_1664680 [compost metagenome]